MELAFARRIRLFHRLALAILTIVCVSLTGAGRGVPNLVPVDAGASDGGGRWALGAEASHHHRRHRAARSVADLKALECDVEEGEALCGVAGDASVALKGMAFPRVPGRAPRCELQIDTSRFASGTGLPRGPPA